MTQLAEFTRILPNCAEIKFSVNSDYIVGWEPSDGEGTKLYLAEFAAGFILIKEKPAVVAARLKGDS